MHTGGSEPVDSVGYEDLMLAPGQRQEEGVKTMFARVTSGEGKPEQIEAAIRSFREQVEPLAKKIPGFKGSHLLVDREKGKIMGIALWDTIEHLQASAEEAKRLSAGITRAGGAVKPPTVEVYEVAVQIP